MTLRLISITDEPARLPKEAEVALDQPLPPFPDLAWRGMFETYRSMMASDPEEPGTPVSECPMAFHFANFLAVVVAEMGDNVRMAEGLGNFYIFCCGRTGTKKSTAGDYIEDYIVKQFPHEPQHVALGSVSSAEGLIRCLVHKPNLLLRYDEVKDLFVTAIRQGQRIEPVINRAFDQRSLEAIVKKKADSLVARDYYLNMIVNGTPDHVLLDLSEALFKGGLLNRFLVFAAKPTGVVKPVKGVPSKHGMKALADELYERCMAWKVVAPKRGEVRMRLSMEAAEVHKEWYTRYTLLQQVRSDLDAAPLTRLDLFVKKLAMAYARCELEPSRTPLIQPEHMESAIAVAEYCSACMQWMIAAWAGARTSASQSAMLMEQRIEGYLRLRGCSYERYIYRGMHFSALDCYKAVNALVAMGVAKTTGEKPRLVHLVSSCKCDT